MLIRRGSWTLRVLAIWCLLCGINSRSALAQTTWSLSAPWSAQDIGGPPIAGDSSFDQGTFTIDASGADIWGQSDQFHFVYQQVSGDVDVIARVDSVSATDAWAKAGLMIRSSLAADAAHGSVFVTGGNGIAFQSRAQDAGSSAHLAGPALPAPAWVRLTPRGTKVPAYSSSDGAPWGTTGSATTALGPDANIGRAVPSHNLAAATTAAISQVAVVT